MPISQLEERKAILVELDHAAKTRERVNEIPEVIEARRVSDEADVAKDKAQRAFRTIFDKHYKNETDMAKELLEKYGQLWTKGDDFPYVMRCVVTGLPLFRGDRVIETRWGDEDYERSYALADAVTISDGIGPAKIVLAGHEDGPEFEKDPE
jgi:hypothetical protein